jgi:transposase
MQGCVLTGKRMDDLSPKSYFKEAFAMNLLPVAGIDVGKEFSELAILSPTNKIYARMHIKHKTQHDFDKAAELLNKAEKDFATKPILIMESTGHYHKILFQYFVNKGFSICIVNPLQTDSIKNIGIRKVKNDKLDARKIALLYRLQELRITNVPDEDIECLRSLCRQYFNLDDELTAYKNRLISIVDQVMLNFTDVFDDICSKTALCILENYPNPDDILKADKAKLIELIKVTSRKGLKWATSKYELLILKATEFKPLSISNAANLALLKVNINMIKTFTQAKDDVTTAIENLLKADSSRDLPVLSFLIELLDSIPGIGIIIAATILAEIGDFSAFSKPNKLTAYFGIDPSVRQSGKFKGTENVMSKRGSRLLRRVLFTVALTNIRKKSNGQEYNPVLLEFYKKKCVNKVKKAAIGAVMHKLVNIIFAVIRNRKPYEFRTPEEHAKMLNQKAIVV